MYSIEIEAKTACAGIEFNAIHLTQARVEQIDKVPLQFACAVIAGGRLIQAPQQSRTDHGGAPVNWMEGWTTEWHQQRFALHQVLLRRRVDYRPAPRDFSMCIGRIPYLPYAGPLPSCSPRSLKRCSRGFAKWNWTEFHQSDAWCKGPRRRPQTAGRPLTHPCSQRRVERPATVASALHT